MDFSQAEMAQTQSQWQYLGACYTREAVDAGFGLIDVGGPMWRR